MTSKRSAGITLLMLTALLATGCTAPEDQHHQGTAAATPSDSPSASASATASSSATATSSPEAEPSSSLPSVNTSPSPAPETSTATANTPSTPSATATPEAGSSTTGQQDPTSLTVLVNKQNPLTPPQWEPSDLTGLSVSTTKSGLQLRHPASEAASALFAAAAADGVSLSVVSAYRSYDYQVGTYQHWVNQQGAAAADRISARPGYSEHQTGLAMDVVGADGACTLETCFESTPAGRWVAEHAAEHGWVIRYPAGAESVTGYSYEPWHLRYVGQEQAAQIMAAGGVVETAWGAPAAPGY